MASINFFTGFTSYSLININLSPDEELVLILCLPILVYFIVHWSKKIAKAKHEKREKKLRKQNLKQDSSVQSPESSISFQDSSQDSAEVPMHVLKGGTDDYDPSKIPEELRWNEEKDNVVRQTSPKQENVSRSCESLPLSEEKKIPDSCSSCWYRTCFRRFLCFQVHKFDSLLTNW